MGDYTFSVSSNVRTLSPVEFQANLGNSALFFSPDQIGHTMQDDLLLEKSAGKQAQSQLSSVETTSNAGLLDRALGDDDFWTQFLVDGGHRRRFYSGHPDGERHPGVPQLSSEPHFRGQRGPPAAPGHHRGAQLRAPDEGPAGSPPVQGLLQLEQCPAAELVQPTVERAAEAPGPRPRLAGQREPQVPPEHLAARRQAGRRRVSGGAGASGHAAVPARAAAARHGAPWRTGLLQGEARAGCPGPVLLRGIQGSRGRPRGRTRQAGQSPGLLAEERQVALLPRRGRAGAGGAAVLAQGRRRGGRGRALLAQGLRGRPAAGHRRGGDHGVLPPLRPARGRLAAQGREQVVLPAQGLRLPALPRRVLGPGAHGRLHSGGGQAVPVREQPHHQGQARADPALAAGRRGLRAGRVAAARPAQDGLRGRRAQAAQGCRAGHDHGPAVRRRLLRRHRHGPGAQVPQGRRPRGLLEPAELHRRHQRPLRAAAARRHREAGGGEAVRARRPDVRRVPGGPVRRQVCALLLRQCDLPAVLLRALLGHHPLPARPRVSQAPGQGRRRPAPGRTLPLVLGGGCDSSPRDNQRLVGPPAGHG